MIKHAFSNVRQLLFRFGRIVRVVRLVKLCDKLVDLQDVFHQHLLCILDKVI